MKCSINVVSVYFMSDIPSLIVCVWYITIYKDEKFNCILLL